ncbi:hypothetical protein CHS0354_012289 [Potamilus streckersoni]|uniref:Amino acid transporter transmembrane domain-containing protein n=1 Tax=Potamilus streckersoni TaxID=2493646 RepID=A0AAE0VUN9_9BIVA|nr:hypothetical protein CHS0354_012289 [Potamilus streckersoni]
MERSAGTGANERSPLLSSTSDHESPNTSRSLSPSTETNQASNPDTRRNGAHVSRQPMSYHSINGGYSVQSDSVDDSLQTSAVISRYKYYNRLAPHQESPLQMPDHVVPVTIHVSHPLSAPGQQNSFITVFSLWNTMMGTSLLSMPWAIKQAGFINGIALLVFMAGLMFYTSYRILKCVEGQTLDGQMVEFSDVCRRFLGRGAEGIAVLSSLLVLLGGIIIYWILMSNFLYNIVSFIYRYVVDGASNSNDDNDALCRGPTGGGGSNNSISNVSDSLLPSFTSSVSSGSLWLHNAYQDGSQQHLLFDKIWDEYYTVPFFLILILVPLINFKSPTFFTKFNALGTVSVGYLICFVAINMYRWGFHLDFSAKPSSPQYIAQFKGTFPALTGIAALAYFVQNCVVSIVRNQKYPENNVRDLLIAYVLVALTYVYIGFMFYAAYPLDKNCIEDNLLNNLKDTNIIAFIARIGLFFQMMCVFPLLSFIFRVQFMHTFFGTLWPGLKYVLLLNLILVAISVVFAIFLPHIGKIIGFVGAFCGLCYAFALPCLVYMKIRYEENTLTWPVLVFHSVLILIGLANFVGQFVILGES